MNMHIHTKEHSKIPANRETMVTESDGLAQSGFTPDEIISLLWFQQWYQNGGSDRVTMVRHLEFLKLLVMNGKLEV
jgi:hypothetical protein